MVNGFDLIFVIIFGVYLGARSYGTWWNYQPAMDFGVDLLAVGTWQVPSSLLILTGAVLMFPRLVFMSLANNLMVLSIRSMLSEFFCELPHIEHG